MKSFYGGQIKKEHQGDLAFIIYSALPGDTQDRGVTLPVLSEPFRYVTGPEALHHSLERIYSGVNQETADELTRQVSDETPVNELDRQIVDPHFLREAVLQV